MPKPANTHLSDAALLAFPTAILAAAVLVILVSALLPGGLIFRSRYACEEPLLPAADPAPAAQADTEARLRCIQADGSTTVYAPGWSVFFSWLVYSIGLFLIFFGIFSRKPRRRKKKR